MKNFYSKILLLCSLLGFSVVNASDYKVGVVNQQIAIENSLCGKQYQESMQKELDSRQVKLTEKKEIVKKKFEGLQRDRDILTKKDLENREKELDDLQQDLQRMHEKFELELSNKDQEEHKKIHKLFTRAIDSIGKREKYDLLLPSNVTFYIGNNITDVTNDVTTELDKVYREFQKEKAATTK